MPALVMLLSSVGYGQITLLRDRLFSELSVHILHKILAQPATNRSFSHLLTRRNSVFRLKQLVVHVPVSRAGSGNG